MGETHAAQKLALMPWLSLTEEIKTGEITFRPMFQNQALHPILMPIASRVESLLKFFPDCKRSGVFVTLKDENWAIPEERLPDLAVAAGHLYLSAFACQNYFSPTGQYVNTAAFDFYGARPTEVASFAWRSRLGRYENSGFTSDFGRFSRPPQVEMCSGLGRLTYQQTFSMHSERSPRTTR